MPETFFRSIINHTPPGVEHVDYGSARTWCGIRDHGSHPRSILHIEADGDAEETLGVASFEPGQTAPLVITGSMVEIVKNGH